MLKKTHYWRLILILLLIFIFWYVKFARHYPNHIDLSKAKENYWGLTYSHQLVEELGLDWQDVYQEILGDLQVKYIRLPFYWEEIEKNEGEFDFTDYDYMLAEGAKQNVKFIANIGWRLPRWPECHAPDWVSTMDQKQIQAKTFILLENIVNRYKSNTSIIYWQVENEPLLDAFGECPPGDLDFLKKEVALVRALDSSRPIIISASGELSWWREENKLADIFGTTLYRVVWSKYLGYFRYPWPSNYYNLKAKLVGVDRQRSIISELQTEPWVPSGNLAQLGAEEAIKSFDLEQFKANLQFAIDMDWQQTYLWGVEWWYVQKENGNSSYWDLAKELFKVK